MLRLGQTQISAKSSPVKMGWLTWAPYDQIPVCELNKLEKALLRPNDPPPEPVSEICGKNCALATPISALAATRNCSASRISGRRSINDEGKPGGTSGGSGCSTSGRPRGTACG